LDNVKLVWITPEAEKLVAYCARVSNPANQDNENISNLLKYCIANKHWSVFEMANMAVEINTTRAISAQILRHRSFSFQEFSQRYAQVPKIEFMEARRQDTKNRQNSIDDLPADIKQNWRDEQLLVHNLALEVYENALKAGIAKEVARAVLPMSSYTRIYMNGTLRSWITYLQVRLGPETQLEHRQIAQQIQKIFVQELPIISVALGWENA
jgi:thymidylate synthase (FAD)